jgi:hypothetical protein
MNAPVIDRTRIATVRARLEEMSGEMPSSSGGGGKGGHSDRTGSLAFRHRINPNDPEWGHLADVAAAASRELDRLERTIILRAENGEPTSRMVARLDDLLAQWEPLTNWQQSSLQSETALVGELGCVSCRRVEDSLGRPLWSPVHDRMDVCLRCHRDLKRQRARDGHIEDVLVHTAVIRWRDRHGDRRLTDQVLDDLLSGKLIP